MKKVNVAVLGATGVVGRTMLEILGSQKDFEVGDCYALASSRSKGQSIPFQDRTLIVEDVESFDFSKAQIALFSAGSSVSAKYAPLAAEKKCIVIDNTSCFRYEDDIPLVVAEVNPHRIADYRKRYIIANPNCSTMQMLVVLKPIYDLVGIERVNIATYQSVSGTGKRAIEELKDQSRAYLDGKQSTPEIYPIPIAFNVIPHIDEFQPNGYTREEMKMVWETQKILEDSQIRINPTAVRVPVFYGHSEALHIETRVKTSAATITELLRNAPGIIVKDEMKQGGYPSPVLDAAGKDPIFVGRIREDLSHPKGLNLWVVGDNIRKGAALNTIQIAKILVRDYL
jgi:aspartate-semialdehyde dehydrogenase